MANPYATVDDLHAYLGTDPPADSQRLLARAQNLVDSATKSSNFAVDANGNPTDALVIAGFNQAVCAQVEYWIASGDELDALGNWASYTMAGLTVTRNVVTRRYRLCDRALDALGQVASVTTFGRALAPGKPVV